MSKHTKSAIFLVLLILTLSPLIQTGAVIQDWSFYPSGYSPLVDTKYVSGTMGDVQSDDNAYLKFRGYVSATSTTTKTDAFVSYGSSTTSLDVPKYKSWEGETVTFGSEIPLDTSGSPVRYTRIAICPVSERSLEKIVVTISDDGKLDAYVFDGTSWTVTNDIGQVTLAADARRPYDVIYESSGDALLVYGTVVVGGTNDLAYRTWSFTDGWGSEQYYDDAGHATKIVVSYVVLASDGNSDKIGMEYIDLTNSDANADIWGGSSWIDPVELTGTISITTKECIAIRSERLSGAFVAVAGEGQFIKWSRFTSSWSSEGKQIGKGIIDINSGAVTAMNWLKLAQSQGNRLMLTSVDSSSDLCTAVWDEGVYGNREWATAAESIGSITAATYATSLRFTAQAAKSVTHILVYIQAFLASPVYRFGIETSATTYLPSGTYVGGVANYAVFTPVALGWLDLTLPAPASLTAGEVYHITVRYDSGTIGTSNYIALRRMGTINNNFRVQENKIDSWLNTLYYTTAWTIQNRDPVFILQYDDATYESMPYDTATAAHLIYGVNWFSEKWVQVGAKTIIGINIPLLRTAVTPPNLYVVLRNETSSQDVATITIPQIDITTTLQWYERYFDFPINLVDGATYRLILKSPVSPATTESFTCRSLSTTQSGSLTYDGTNSVYSVSANSGSSWTDTDTRDLIYILLDGSVTGGGFVVHTPHDTGVDSIAQRCADFAWEYYASPAFMNQGLLVYGTTAGQIAWKIIKAPSYLATASSGIMGTAIHPWVQLESNPRTVSGDVKVLGAVMEGTIFDLGAISWDGATFTVIGTNTFTADTTVITYECFDLKFQFYDPSEFKTEVEFTGTSNLESWAQLTWTIDSSFTTIGVNTTFQLWNYTASGYSPPDNGYMIDTIGIADVTKTQVIDTNSDDFRDGEGSFKLKVTGIKSTSSQFDCNLDLILLNPHRHDNWLTTFYIGGESEGCIFNVNGVTVTNGTGLYYPEQVTIVLQATVAANNTRTFDHFIIGEDQIYDNNHEYVVAGENTIWCYFSDIEPTNYTIARFSFSPLVPVVNETILFDGTSSVSNQHITYYSWNFGDNNVTSGYYPTIVHSWKANGTYIVTLSLTQEKGGGDDFSLSVMAGGNGGNGLIQGKGSGVMLFLIVIGGIGFIVLVFRR